MTTRSNANRSDAQRINPPHDDTQDAQVTINPDLLRLMFGMMEEQRNQRETQNGFIRTVTDMITAPKEPRVGNISDFRKLNPKTFAGTESPLEAEQWLTDMANLLEGANVPDADKVRVVKVQFTDVARTWWLVEEAKQQESYTWEQFSNGFLEKFFPKTAKKDMEEKFVNLKQGDRSVDDYAAEFTRLSRFASCMVATEEARAERFQQGLNLDTQMFLETLQLTTYSQVITVARGLERLQAKKNEIKKKEEQAQQKNLKRQNGNGNKNGDHGTAPPAKRPNQQQQVCNHCGKPGHVQRDCRSRLGLCLICGSAEHRIGDCPKKRPQTERLALPAPAPPAQGRLPNPPRGQNNQAQGAARGRGQNFNLIAGQALAETGNGKLEAGSELSD